MQTCPSTRDLRIRSIRADDWRRLQQFHVRLSPSTIYLRFHAQMSVLSDNWAKRLTDLDGLDAAAFVVTTGTRGRIVGVAHYFRIGSTTVAEVALVVEDTYQGCGLGSRLMRRLVAHARRNGITELNAMVLLRNEQMVKLLRAAGPTRLQTRDGTVDVTVHLGREAA